MGWLTKLINWSDIEPVKSVNGGGGDVIITEPKETSIGRRPDKETMEVLALGFIPEVRMICAQWLEWAIIYTDSDIPIPCVGYKPDLVEYYKYIQVLRKACQKYLVEGEVK